MVEKSIGGGSGTDEIYLGHIYKLDMEISDFHIHTKHVYFKYYEALDKAIEEALKLI